MVDNCIEISVTFTVRMQFSRDNWLFKPTFWHVRECPFHKSGNFLPLPFQTESTG